MPKFKFWIWIWIKRLFPEFWIWFFILIQRFAFANQCADFVLIFSKAFSLFLISPIRKRCDKLISIEFKVWSKNFWSKFCSRHFIFLCCSRENSLAVQFWKVLKLIKKTRLFLTISTPFILLTAWGEIVGQYLDKKISNKI